MRMVSETVVPNRSITCAQFLYLVVDGVVRDRRLTILDKSVWAENSTTRILVHCPCCIPKFGPSIQNLFVDVAPNSGRSLHIVEQVQMLASEDAKDSLQEE